MNWATRRRLFIVLVILAIVGVFAYSRYAAVFNKPPMCTDGIQNGTETGVDCGGNMCSTMCSAEVRLPTILWQRAFAVTPNVYNVASFVENKNNAAAKAIPYEFNIYDTDNVLLARRNGVALVPPLGRYAIVETGIQTGNGKVGVTEFLFSKAPVEWTRISSDISKLRIATSDISLDTSGLFPKLSATLTNTSPTATLTNTVVSAVVYDAADNAVNASKTIVPVIAPLASMQVVFTWPRPFTKEIVRYDIVPSIDVFNVK